MVVITVTAGTNDPPTADAGPDQSVDEGVMVTLDGSASDDPEDQTLTFAWTQVGASTVSLSSATAERPTFDAPTELLTDLTLTFSLTVSDGMNTSAAADTVVITVTAGNNDLPIVEAGNPQTVAEGTPVTLTGSGTDPEGQTLTFLWTQVDTSTVSLTNPAMTTATFTAPTQLVNNLLLTFRLTATEPSGGQSGSDMVIITVTAGTNDPPTADAGPDQSVDEGVMVTLDGSASDDPEDQTLTFAWTQVGASTVSLSSATAERPTFDAPDELLTDLTLTFSLTVSDGMNTSAAADTVVITITAGPNDPPIVEAGNPQTVGEGTPVTLTGSGTDPEGQTLTFLWTQVDTSTVSLTNPTMTTATFTAPTQLVNNVLLTFRLTATEPSGGQSGSDMVVITVTAGTNDPPTADAGPDQRVDEGVMVTLDGSASDDPEDQTLTFAWTQVGASTVSLSSATAERPTFDAPDELLTDLTLTFSLTVSDGMNTSAAADTVIITITAGPNDPPIVEAGEPQTVAEGTPVTLTGSATDPEGQTLTFLWTQVDTATVSLTNAAMTTATFTAPTQLANNLLLTFRLTATEPSGGQSGNDMVVITVTAGTNDPPTADAGPDQSVDEGVMVTLDGSASDDPENQTLTFAWTRVGDNTPMINLSSATAERPTFDAPDELLTDVTLTFSLTVSDGMNTSAAADTVVITITAGPNDPPIVEAGNPQTVGEGASVTLTGSGTDPEGQTLTFLWTQVDTSTVSLTNPTMTTASFTAPTQLVNNVLLTFRLTATEPSGGQSGSDMVVITVTAGINDPPTADAGPDQSVDEGTMVTLDGSASDDPEDQTLTFAWTRVGDNTPMINLSSATAERPTFDAPDELLTDVTLTFSLTVSDGMNTSAAADTVVITVTAGPNDPPIVEAGNPQTVGEGTPVTLTGSATDPEGQTLTFLWTQVDTATVSLTNPTMTTATFTAPTQLVNNVLLTFRLTATEPGDVQSGMDMVVITVTAGTNDPPTADAGPDQSVDEGTMVTLDGSASDDPEDQTLTFAWTQVGASTVSLSSATAERPTFDAPDELLTDLTLTFSLTVSDGMNTSAAADTVVITITAGPNDLPIVDAGEPQTVGEGTPVTLTGSATDPEGQTLTFLWTQVDTATVSLTNPTMTTATFTAPTQLVNNVLLTFRLTATEPSGGQSGSDMVVITVTAGTNDPPTADAGPDQSVDEGTMVTLDGSASDDPEDQTLTFAWTQTGSTSTVSLSSATAERPTFDAPTELLTDLTLTFSLTVSDGMNTSAAADTVVITITAGPNDPPIVEAGNPQTVGEGTPVTLTGSGTDPEGQTLTFLWTQVDTSTVSLTNPTMTTATFTAPTQLVNNLLLTFRLTATEPSGGQSGNDMVVITVTAGTNDPPTADAGPDQNVDEGTMVTLDGSASDDPEDQTLTFMWTRVGDNTPIVNLSSTTAERPTFTAPTELLTDLTLTFSLTVSDGMNTSAAADTVVITITAGPNDPPIVEAGEPQTVGEGTPVTLTGSGTDPEGQTLTFLWTQVDTSTVSLTNAAMTTATFTAPTQLANNLLLTFRLTATEPGDVQSGMDMVVITVTAGTNDPPTADAGPDQSVDEGVMVTLDGSASDDPEDQTLTFAWTQTGSTSTVNLSSATAERPTFDAPDELLTDVTLTFSLTVRDGMNNSTSPDTVVITVTAGNNDPPIVEAGNPQTVGEGTPVTLTGSATDPEGQTLTFLWTQVDTSTVVLTNATTTTATFTAPTQLANDLLLTFRLTATEPGDVQSGDDTVIITVTAGINDPPTADAGPDQSVDEGVMVTLDGSASDDPEDQTLTFAWTRVGDNMPMINLSSATAERPTFDAPDELLTDVTLTFSLTVSDGMNTSAAADTVIITVTAGNNDPPIVEAGNPQTVGEGTPVTLTGSATDPEGQTLTFLWTQVDTSTVSLTNPTMTTATFTAPTQLANNLLLTFRLTATEPSGGQSGSDMVVITVTAGTNDPPTADAGPDQSVDEGAMVTLDGSASDDPEDQTLTFMWTRVGDNTPIVNLSSTTAERPTFTAPTELLTDLTLTFSLTVSDGMNTSAAADTVVITVTAGNNDPPIVEAGNPQTVGEGTPVTLTGSATDPEGQTLTFLWTQVDTSTVSLTNPTMTTATFTAPTQLVNDLLLTFRLTATEPSGGQSGSDMVVITVTAGTNDPPTADAGPDQSVDEGAMVTLDGSASDDPEDQTLTFAWTQVGSTSTVNLSSATAERPTFTAPTELLTDLTLTFSLTVSDGMNTSAAADTVIITVTAGNNDPPIVEAGNPQTVAEGTPVTLTGSATDPEGQTLTFLWTQVDTSTVSLTNPTMTTATFTAPTQLVNNVLLTFRLTATEPSGGQSGNDMVVITVTAGINDPPIADAGTPQTVAEGVMVTLDGSASDDPEDQTLTFAWTQVGTPTVSLSSATAERPTFDAPTELLTNVTLTFSLTVSDGMNTSAAADTVIITVTAGNNDPPIVEAGNPQTVGEGTPVTLTGSATDPEGQTLTFLWTQVDTATVSLTNPTMTTATFTAPTQLVNNVLLTFRLTATEPSGGQSGNDMVVITVTAGPNDVPVVEAGNPQTVGEGASVTLTGSGTDPEGQIPLTFMWTQVGASTVVLTNAATTTASFTAPIELANDLLLTFRLTATEPGGGQSGSAIVIITVTAGPNDAPTADAGPDQTVGEGATVTLDGRASDDPEDQTLTFMWTQTGGTLTVSLDDAIPARPTFDAPDELLTDVTLTFSLTVRDGMQPSAAADTVIITVTAGTDDPPTARAGPDQTVNQGVTVTLDGNGSNDPEKQTLTFAWTQTGGTPTVDLSSATAERPTFDAPDELLMDLTLTFSLTVNDGTIVSTPDEVVITVTNADEARPAAIAELNEAILPEVARIMVDNTVRAIVQRIEQAKRAEAGVSVGGQRSLAAVLTTHGASMSDGTRTMENLLGDSEFVVPLNAGDQSATTKSSATLWGDGAYRELSGESGGLNWDGELSGVHLGVDAQVRSDLLAGMTVSWLRGDFDYNGAAGLATGLSDKGKYDIDLTSVNPYLGWSTGTLDLWATTGYSEGDLEIREDGEAMRSSDITQRTIGIGGSSQLWQMGITDVRLKGEVLTTKLEVEGNTRGDARIIAQDVDATSVRVSVESKQSRSLASGGVYEPSLEVGVRYDGGDGETGGGAEIGGGLRYTNPATRVTIEGRARALLGSGGNYREWGISGSLRLQPGADGQGLSLTISPGYGQSGTGIQALWDQGLSDADTANKTDPTAAYRTYLDARIGYGLSLRRWGVVLTPYSEFTIGNTNTYRLGLNWKSGTRYNLTLSGEHRDGTTSSQAILLKGEVRF